MDLLPRCLPPGDRPWNGPEAYWPAMSGAVEASRWCEDVLMGYPSTDRHAVRELPADEQACRRVTLMVDSVDHLDVVDAVAAATVRPEVRVAIDLDLALESGQW